MVENNIQLQSHSKPFKTRILKTKLLHYLLSENNIYTVCTNVRARAGRIRQAFWKKHKTARRVLNSKPAIKPHAMAKRNMLATTAALTGLCLSKMLMHHPVDQKCIDCRIFTTISIGKNGTSAWSV